MTHPSLDHLLTSYCGATWDPDVSGIEHHHMLCIRSEIASCEHLLSFEQRAHLSDADQRLISQAAAFWRALSSSIDLPAARTHHLPSPQSWWWYLDVIAALPTSSPSLHP